jgi:hypothetical protein
LTLHCFLLPSHNLNLSENEQQRKPANNQSESCEDELPVYHGPILSAEMPRFFISISEAPLCTIWLPYKASFVDH